MSQFPNRRGHRVKSEQVLAFIKAYLKNFDRVPTKQRIANHFKFASTNSSGHHINALIEQGALVKLGRYYCFPR